jgi:hypothetical protein
MTGFNSKREAAADKLQEPVCDKDQQGCWNVRCQLGKQCKNLAQPAPQLEAVAWVWKDMRGQDIVSLFEPRFNSVPLYTAPLQREWVGLTDDEIDYQAKKDDHGAYFALGALWAGAKLKERNHGT